MEFSWFIGYLSHLCSMNLLQAEQAFKTSLAHLYEANEARSLLLLCIKHLYGWDRTYYLLHRQDLLSDTQASELLSLLNQLESGKPVQYILSETEFYGLTFLVNSSVLIPRPETEELVKWVLDTCQEGQLNQPRILDIGTGSGCIPISLKKNQADAAVSALDISKTALATAKKNAELNQVEIDFIHQDILASTLQLGEWDMIISNPPYVTLAEKAQMRSNVLDHEPHTALFVPDNDPLVFYRRIADLAATHISPKGYLFFEINEHLSSETVAMLQEKGFSKIELRKDLPGKDRMIRCKLS
jgi:release factor glutamine methyltransferase